MAAFPRKRQPFTSQPQYPPQIDNANPLCRGLVDVALPIGGMISSPQIMSGQGNTLWTDTATPTTAANWRFGNTKLYNGSTQYSSRGSVPAPFNAAASSLKECSMMVLWRSRGSLAASNFICAYGLSSSNNPFWGLGLDASGTHFAMSLRDTAATAQNTAGAATIAVSTDYVLIGTRSEANNFHRLYVNGVQDLSTTCTALGSASFDRAATGGLLRAAFGSAQGGNVALVLVWNRSLSPLEAMLLYQNPWQVFEAPQPLILAKSISAGGISGTASITEADDTLSAAGTVKIQGAASPTEADDTLAATGTLKIQGAASVTEADDTVVGTGALKIQATASITEDADTLVATGSGTPSTTGTASITEADDTVAATGTLKVQGTGAITEADDTVSAAGTVKIQGVASITEGDDTSTATGTLKIQGAATITEAGDTVVATGTNPAAVVLTPDLVFTVRIRVPRRSIVCPRRQVSIPVPRRIARAL